MFVLLCKTRRVQDLVCTGTGVLTDADSRCSVGKSLVHSSLLSTSVGHCMCRIDIILNHN